MKKNLAEIFENFWLEKAKIALGVPAETSNQAVLEKIRPAVAELSDLFTKERPKNFRDYMSEKIALAAYGLFFFQQSFARAEFAAKRLTEFCARGNDKNSFKILDLGSGAAPCAFAFANVLHEKFPAAEIEILAVDRSRNALNLVPEIAKKIAGNWLKIETFAEDLKNFSPQKNKNFDFAILGFSLNEIVPADAPESVEKTLEFFKKISATLNDAGTLVALEPALKLTSERLQKVGDFFAEFPGTPFFRVAPELGNHVDPQLASGETWNHEVRRWNVPATLEFLNRKLFREVSVLKFSWRALAKKPLSLPNLPAGTSEFLRLISPIEITKPALRFSAVNAAGTRLNIEIPTRNFSKNECKKIAEKWERGDIAALAGTFVPAGNSGNFRLAGTLVKAA